MGSFSGKSPTRAEATAHVLAAKIDKYMRFCQRKVKDVDGKERPMWRTRWWVPATATSRTRRCYARPCGCAGGV
ncbi:hypothetical protein C3489_07850 [Streptomyces sp. Ru71]|nr:hypothetical protein C3489_07850 [Streptomyces sp. Ru71]